MASNVNIYTTGYDVQVVDSYPPLLNCGICTLILRDAMHGCINHVFCKACITKHIECGIKTDGKVMCPGGCNIVINPAKVEPSKVVDRMVNTLTTRCSNDGCTWKGDLLDLVQVHQINCDFILQPCVNSGCNQKYLKKDILQHNEECLFKLIQCDYCQTYIPRMNKEAHAVECLNEHVKCIYYNIGCKKELCRKDIHSHEQTSHAEHTRLIYQSMTNSNNQIKHLNQEIVVLKQENATSKKKYEEDINIFKNDIAQLKQHVQNNTTGVQVVKNENSKVRYDVSKTSDKLDVASNEVVLMKSKKEVENINILKEKLNMNRSLRGNVSLVDDDKVLFIKCNNSKNINLCYNKDFVKCYETNDFDWLCDQFGLIDNKGIIMELINHTKYHLYEYYCFHVKHYVFVFPLDLHHIKDTEVVVPDMFKMTIIDNQIMVEILCQTIPEDIFLTIENHRRKLTHQKKLNIRHLDDFQGVHLKCAKGFAFLLLFSS